MKKNLKVENCPNVPSSAKCVNNGIHAINGILLSNITSNRTRNKCNSMDEFQMHNTKRKKSDVKAAYCMILFI